MDGFTSFSVICPEHGFGVVVLSNMHNSLAPFALAYRVIDAYLGIAETDWSAYFLSKRAEHRNNASPHKEDGNENEPSRETSSGSKIGPSILKTLLSFAGGIIAAIAGIYVMNMALMAGTFNPIGVLVAGIVFGIIGSIACAVADKPSMLGAATRSGITLGAMLLAFGGIAWLAHSIELADMLLRAFSMACIGFVTGLGFHIGGSLRS